MKKAVVLLSGGLDSTTNLYYAKAKGYQVHSLIFDYGQRHRKEVLRAEEIARKAGCPSHVVKIALPWRGSSLLDKTVRLPRHRRIHPDKIPSTYVPARNIIFLGFAVSLAETIHASAVFIGANAIDYSGYPDCRPEFFSAFSQAVKKGTKKGVQGKKISIIAPFLFKTKAQIIKTGLRLNVPYESTWSCYRGGRRPCGVCDSCILRRRGFDALNVKDPASARK
jgi:7-cyano-7-deazaguanine synthase